MRRLIPALLSVVKEHPSVGAWFGVLTGFALSRVVSTALLAAAFAYSMGAGASIFHVHAGETFLDFLQSWDGAHYRSIVERGYPTQLPLDGLGDVRRNSWAFLPLYPALVRVVMFTGIPFSTAAIVVSVAAGAAATSALFVLLRARMRLSIAIFGSLLFAFGPMAFLLETAYADGLFAFLMFSSLILIRARRWLLVIPVAILASFTHPGAIALAPAIALIVGLAILRRDPGLALREKVSASVAVLVIGLAGFAWPLIAGIVTHDPSAYFDTETAWWKDYIGRQAFVPFTPWFIFANHFAGLVGVAAVIAVVIVFAVAMFRPGVTSLGFDLKAFTVSYFAYLVAVFLPQQSLFRMLLPLSFLGGVPALWVSRRRRIATFATAIALQAGAVILLWVIWPP